MRQKNIGARSLTPVSIPTPSPTGLKVVIGRVRVEAWSKDGSVVKMAP
jgi:hypothetical protein